MKLFKKHSIGHGQKLYGPPEMLEDNRKKKISLRKSSSAECIYGPPEMLEARRLGKPWPPRPEENVAEDVYGPPEMLGALWGKDDEPDDEENMK